MPTQTVNVGKDPVSLHITVESRKPSHEIYVIAKGQFKPKIYYYRQVDNPTTVVNLPVHPSEVTVYTNADKISNIITEPLKFPSIPYVYDHKYRRNYDPKEIEIRTNNNIRGPARMSTKEPWIEFNPQ